MADEFTPDQLAELDEPVAYLAPEPTPCGRLIGCAGTGKSYMLGARMKADPNYGLLTATTGISAVHIGAQTLNSTLKYFDTASMRDILINGALAKRLHKIGKTYPRIIIEEYSMLDADALDILKRGVDQANTYKGVTRPLGILLVGDLAQLPPVKARWCFEAASWPVFASATEKLTKVWRQADGPFLDALNWARAGYGEAAVNHLRGLVPFESQLDTEFDGTTILPKNRSVDNYNWDRLRRVPGEAFTLPARRWGDQRPEWGQSKRTHEWGIPPQVELKVGAYVMLLANQPDHGYVNGDCGHVVGHIIPKPPYAEPGEREHLIVHLVREDREVNVYPVVRSVSHTYEPYGWDGYDWTELGEDDDYYAWHPEPFHYKTGREDERTDHYVTGQIEHWPVRLAYASTVHKSQSLTLDRVQVDFRDQFFGESAMLYVALSRCRTMEGLRLVGDAARFVKHCNVDRRVLPWI